MAVIMTSFSTQSQDQCLSDGQANDSQAVWPCLSTTKSGAKRGLKNRSLAKETQAAVKIQVAESEETTDAGSGVSDGESTCSSTAGECKKVMQRNRTRCFTGTPLETIPGTPMAVAAHHATTPGKQRQHEQTLLRRPPGLPSPMSGDLLEQPSAGATSSQGPVNFSRALPVSPKKRAREALLVKARREAVPLKVRVPVYDGQICKPLDSSLPVKKRPPFSELFESITAAAQNLHPENPAKKKLSAFLLEAPPSMSMMLTPPPGLKIEMPVAPPPGLKIETPVAPPPGLEKMQTPMPR